MRLKLIRKLSPTSTTRHIYRLFSGSLILVMTGCATSSFNPSTTDKAPFVKMLADGMKAGDLVVLAADTALNTTNIGLVGLMQTGIEYTN